MLTAIGLALALQLTPSQEPDPFDDPVSENQARRITPEVVVAHNARPAVVYIETDVIQTVGIDWFGRAVQRQGTSGGSGVVIFDEGFVVTNYHVIKGAQRISVRFDNELDPQVYSAREVSSVPSEDLALIKIEAPGPFPTVPLGTSSDLMIAEPVIAIGNPLGQTLTVSRGIISGLHRNVAVGGIEFEGLIQTDASINPGNSGGPLLNINGELIGINTAMNAAAENIGFAIPVDRLRQVLEESLLSPRMARAWYGFGLDEQGEDPLRVSLVMPGSPADQAGLRIGDRLVSIDGRSLEDPEAYGRARVVLAPGVPAEFEVQRGERTLSTTLEGWNRIDALLYERSGLRVEPQIFANGRRQVTMMRITDVRSDGPGAALGLRTGDLIEALRAERRRPVLARSAEDLAYYLSVLPASTKIDLDVWRAKASQSEARFQPNLTQAELLRGTLVLE